MIIKKASQVSAGSSDKGLRKAAPTVHKMVLEFLSFSKFHGDIGYISFRVWRWRRASFSLNPPASPCGDSSQTFQYENLCRMAENSMLFVQKMIMQIDSIIVEAHNDALIDHNQEAFLH
jgi:hypothetical protein